MRIIVVALLAGLGTACVNLESKARESLNGDGITDVAFTPKGESFDFTGKRGDEECSGNILVASNWNGSNVGISKRIDCKSPMGPRESDLPERASERVRAMANDCDAGGGGGCNGLAGAYKNGTDGLPVSSTIKKALYEQGCALEDGPACTNLGLDMVKNGSTQRSMVEGLVHLERACELKDGLGCRNAAVVALELGEPERAFEITQQGCTSKHADSCAEMGHKLLNGIGTPVDIDAAVNRFEQACEAGSAMGCLNYGLAFENGWSRPKNLPLAKAQFKKSCELGDKGGCEAAVRSK